MGIVQRPAFYSYSLHINKNVNIGSYIFGIGLLASISSILTGYSYTISSDILALFALWLAILIIPLYIFSIMVESVLWFLISYSEKGYQGVPDSDFPLSGDSEKTPVEIPLGLFIIVAGIIGGRYVPRFAVMSLFIGAVSILSLFWMRYFGAIETSYRLLVVLLSRSDTNTNTNAVDTTQKATSSTDSTRSNSNTVNSNNSVTQPSRSREMPLESNIPDSIPRTSINSFDYETLTNKQVIGSGGSADVVKAELPTPKGNIVVAIKEPRMQETLHTEVVERILKEAETWEKLADHNYIVDIIDYGSNPFPWIAMEYMDGGHLGLRINKMGGLQTLWTAIAVTDGVHYAHRRGVAHLDLKPENILFRTVEDAWDVPKVADWGLSKQLLEHSKSIEAMSPHYAAPEQFDETYGSTDDLTDIYQLGAVFYELFTEQPPFSGRPAKVMHDVLHNQPPQPSDIANVPHELDEILMKALATERTDRYDSVVLLRNDLQTMFRRYS